MAAQNDPRSSVVLLLGAENGATGTAFAIRRVGDQTWLLTCAHVVEDLGGADMIRVKLGDRKLSVTQIARGSADAVDLALLAVQGLALPPLSLHTDGKTDEACRITGFAEVDKHYGAQPLKATLRDWFPLETQGPRVRAWPLRIIDDVELASGYSGAPVLRADSPQVLAVTTHKEYGGERGYAIDIGELPKIYPPAAAFLVASEAEPAHEYATESDAPLVKIFDHTDQLPALHDLLRASDRSIALITACAEDWPSYLGDHLHLDPWPDQDRGFEEAVMLPPPRYDARALWQALIDAAPGARLALDDPGRIGAVRDWINGPRFRVFYVPVELERYGRRLPEMIRGAAETLRDLGDFPARTRMLVLFAAVRASKHLPLWWHFYARFRLARLVCCRSLDAMRFLDKADIETWYARFPAPMRRYYDPDRLKAELLALFPSPAERIPYETARACLVGSQGEGALERARFGP